LDADRVFAAQWLMPRLDIGVMPIRLLALISDSAIREMVRSRIVLRAGRRELG